jgi:hypothetical protein
MKAVRPVASRLGLGSSTARRSKPLGKRNATAQAVEGNLGGFCVGESCSSLRLARARSAVRRCDPRPPRRLRPRQDDLGAASDHNYEGIPVDQAGGKFHGDAWGHVVAPTRQGIIEAVALC